MIAQRRRLLQVCMPAQRTDAIRAVGVGPVKIEARNVVDVDQRGRTREPKLHHRDEPQLLSFDLPYVSKIALLRKIHRNNADC